jgi:hypothetical protein
MTNLTPGGWLATKVHEGYWDIFADMPDGKILLGSSEVYRSEAEARANAELWAASKDHALLLRAMVKTDAAGKYITIGTVPYPVTLDNFGCPVLSPELRAALERLEGTKETTNDLEADRR